MQRIRHIWLVEENIDDLLIFKHIFSRKEFSEVALTIHRTCAEVMTCLELLKHDSSMPCPDILIIGGQTHGVRCDFLDWLKTVSVARELPAIVLSPNSSKSEITRLLASGADSFIKKPAQLAGIESMFREVIGYWNRRLERSSSRFPALPIQARPEPLPY